ncbi:MAG TPA: hypothetical protein VMB27_16980 [Solirubrobacteraceae bacterium]|nr:hypothetical protein [Solirubrobacteraceae bacterium]
MTEDIETSSTQPTADASPGGASPGGASPGAADSIPLQARAAALAEERPEVAVGAAFAGGLVVALILKRLAR